MIPFFLDLNTDVNDEIATKVSNEATEYRVYTSVEFPPSCYHLAISSRDNASKRDIPPNLFDLFPGGQPSLFTDLTFGQEHSNELDQDSDPFFADNYDVIVNFPKPKSKKATVKIRSVSKFKPQIVID